jgi:transketolase
MLHEAMTASELLAEQGFGLAVVNMPWLNRVDAEWLLECVAGYDHVYVLEDHGPAGGLADSLRRALAAEGASSPTVRTLAISGYPACGTPPEVLHHHGLDGASLAKTIAAGSGTSVAAEQVTSGYSSEAPQ